ncbi:uncharacterized protein LOC124823113 [Vigna umbellata]|uniref:uncharacterized protein LOC124823113 n=1 Tax=Vigna umbellata TaxID=87088 RepID=UPI001F5F13D5|nr:uncharacterized protein LOC124823113 [Vigna umbellata]
MTPTELVNTKQEKDETLKAFMQRYNETARRVKDANHTFVINNLPSYLKPGYFAKQLYAKPPKSMEELQEKIAKFIHIEDLRNSRKKQQQEVPTNENKKEAKRPSNGNKGQEYLKKPYTPNSSRSKGNADESRTCRFHQNHGHNTKDCSTLKDEIESIVRAGYPHKYVKEEAARARSPPRGKITRRSPERTSRKDDRHRRHSGSRTRDPERERSVRGRIDTIYGGFAVGGIILSSQETFEELKNCSHDFHASDPDQDDPMVITVEIARYDVSKVLIDQGSSVNILYWATFLKMDLSEDIIAPFNEQIVGSQAKEWILEDIST